MNDDNQSNILKIEENININDGIKIITKIIYIEDKNTAQKRYYEKNKEKLNEYSKKIKKERYKNDPEYREKILLQNKYKKSYQKI